jgi:ribulose kinase
MNKEEGRRRSFLKHILAGTAAVAATAAVVRPAKAKSERPAMRRPEETLYRESESFKKYYKTLR